MSAIIVGDFRGEAAEVSAIQPHAKDAAEKTPADNVGRRIWSLGGLGGAIPESPEANYAPPWDIVCRELWARLLGVLASPAVLQVAGPASLLDYAECTKVLRDGAPVVYRIIMEIRGLALALAAPKAKGVAPATRRQQSARPGAPLAPKSGLPGEPLVYDNDTIN
jgi:hypothetical protein